MASEQEKDFQFRAMNDGKVYQWRRGKKPPLEARWEFCPKCKCKLEKRKREAEGEKGKIEREYWCPKCGEVGRIIKRQRKKDSRYVLKEPEARKR